MGPVAVGPSARVGLASTSSPSLAGRGRVPAKISSAPKPDAARGARAIPVRPSRLGRLGVVATLSGDRPRSKSRPSGAKAALGRFDPSAACQPGGASAADLADLAVAVSLGLTVLLNVALHQSGHMPVSGPQPLFSATTKACAAASAAYPHLDLPAAATAVATGAAGAAASASHAASAAAASTWDAYSSWLGQDPLLCKVVTGNLFTVMGDAIAQLTGPAGAAGAHDAGGSEKPAAAPGGARSSGYDGMRTLRLCIETSLFGTPLSHWWFNYLEANIYPHDPQAPTTLVAKMALDQLVMAPLGLAIFFIIIRVLEGRPADIPETLRSKYPKAVLGGLALWPAANFINFTLVPLQYRVLFANCVNIGWTFFLSRTQARAPEPAPSSAAALASYTSDADDACPALAAALLAGAVTVGAMTAGDVVGSSPMACAACVVGVAVAIEAMLPLPPHLEQQQQQSYSHHHPEAVPIAHGLGSSPLFETVAAAAATAALADMA